MKTDLRDIVVVVVVVVVVGVGRWIASKREFCGTLSENHHA